jgi:hypothetical protein
MKNIRHKPTTLTLVGVGVVISELATSGFVIDTPSYFFNHSLVPPGEQIFTILASLLPIMTRLSFYSKDSASPFIY